MGAGGVGRRSVTAIVVVVLAALTDGLLVGTLADREVGGLPVLAAGVDRHEGTLLGSGRARTGAAVLAVPPPPPPELVTVYPSPCQTPV